MRIDVERPQLIAARRERIEEALLGEAVAGLRPPVVVGKGGKVIQHLLHAAVLGIENLLHVRGGFRSAPLVGPARHAFENLESLLVAGELVHIQHAGHDLVDGVERRPGELRRIGLLAARLAGERIQPVEQLVRKGAEISAA